MLKIETGFGRFFYDLIINATMLLKYFWAQLLTIWLIRCYFYALYQKLLNIHS